VEPLLGQQGRQIEPRHPSRNHRELRADAVGVPVAQVSKPTIDVAPAPAFGNEAVLQRLRRSDRLHRPDIEFLVVVDGDRFVAAWGEALWSGSLARWAWRQTAPREAHYDESRWVQPNIESGMVVRVRRRAVLVWPEPE
jgi:hypothetical protein